MTNLFEQKLEALRAIVEKEQNDEARLSGFTSHHLAIIIPGTKYMKVDVGYADGHWSGKYMIEKSTGNIYGIKGYGQVHKGHWYGNLDEIAKFYWGTYHAIKKIDWQLQQLKDEGRLQ